ncbi:MAG TPA: 30S ribosomal protein S1 [Candidatus Cloacimonadota bacterium]|nr:30S ribosomal protein S1 [Candidatus Cloacimonadota bacterium]
MLTHDQNHVPTDPNDESQVMEPELKEGEDTTSKPIVDAPESETEAPAEETVLEKQAQAAPPVAETPETVAEPPAQETTQESTHEAPVEEPKQESMPETSAEEPKQEDMPEAPAEEPAPKPKPRPASIKAVNPEALDEDHEAMLELIEEYSSNVRRGQIVEGKVVAVNDREVVVAVGGKSDGVVQLSEFDLSEIPEVDSTIMVYINDMDNGEGRLSLSKKRADYVKNIELIRQSAKDGSTLNGSIKRRVKGGMIVNVLGIEAFLPGSQMSLKPIPNLDQFIGKEMSFKIISLDEEHRNIILSRRQVLEQEALEKRAELLEKLQVDAELDGEVKNITQYGAFIDLGGIDGLLHITDMSWGKINHPSEMLAIGDKVKVKVIKFDTDTNKISLGLKQLVPHPWENIEIKYPEGVRVTGKVISIKSFGAFLELEPGVEGLVHISEMSWTKKITDARKILKIGDTVNAIVLELDKENKRLSLGMKQMDANPWLSIEDHFPVGTVLTRKIKSLTAFGAFVEIEDGIDGLIHISDISWTKRIYHPREVYRKGQEVESVILSIDRALHRIALGVKQLHPDPWANLNVSLPINTEVIGKISKLIPKGVLVDVQVGEDLVEGFIPTSHLAIPKLEHTEDAFHVGEELPLKVIELDMENRRLILSVKAFFFSRDPKLQEEYIALHEQYMREHIALQLKKKAERKSKKKHNDRGKTAEDVTESSEEKQVDGQTADQAAEESEQEPAIEETHTDSSETEETAPVMVSDTSVPEEPVEEAPAEEVLTKVAPEPESEASTPEEPVEEVPAENTPEVPTEEVAPEVAPAPETEEVQPEQADSNTEEQ